MIAVERLADNNTVPYFFRGFLFAHDIKENINIASYHKQEENQITTPVFYQHLISYATDSDTH